MAEKLRVDCNCGARFKAEPRLAGKRVKCRRCGKPLAIPDDLSLRLAPLDDDLEVHPVPNIPLPGKPTTGVGSPPVNAVSVGGREATCPRCKRSLVANNAVICIDCGFDRRTQKRIQVDPSAGSSIPSIVWFLYFIYNSAKELIVFAFFGFMLFGIFGLAIFIDGSGEVDMAAGLITALILSAVPAVWRFFKFEWGITIIHVRDKRKEKRTGTRGESLGYIYYLSTDIGEGTVSSWNYHKIVVGRSYRCWADRWEDGGAAIFGAPFEDLTTDAHDSESPFDS